MRRFTVWVAAAALTSLSFGTAHAQEEASGPNNGKVSLSFGLDAASAYYFRGIPQENQGVIFQPSAGISFALADEAGPLSNIALNIGTWNSWHTSGSPSQGWYESDIALGFSGDLPAGFSASVDYINLFAPTGGGIFAEEFDFGLSWDESTLLEGLPFSIGPSAVVAIEVDGGSDNGSFTSKDEGIYLQLGIEPSIPLTEGEYGLTLSLPVTAGFSLDDYYEDGAGGDDFWGFLDVAAAVSVPLAFVDPAYGSWSASFSVHGIFLNDSVQNIGSPAGFNVTDGGDFEWYAMAGVAMEY